MKPLRVMIFDQSASVRTLLSREIQSRSDLACVGSAPATALRESFLEIEGSDVVVIGIDQLEPTQLSDLVTRFERKGTPAIVLCAPGKLPLAEKQCPKQWLSLEKPRSPKGWQSLCSTVVSALEGLEIHPDNGTSPGKQIVKWGQVGSKLDLITIGGSAGGPDATGVMLKAIGESLEEAAVVIVQHIGEGFEADYVQWLERLIPWTNVRVAEDGEVLAPGNVRIAGSGSHLEISPGKSLRLDRESSPVHGHRPSVDHLFKSLSQASPEKSAAVLLSGMGVDGVEGLLSLKRAGFLTLVQDRSTCSVFGMPREALERGAASTSLPPAELGKVLRGLIVVGREQ